jgi:hypothetical protein
MNRLTRIVRSETPSTSVQFRKSAYGKNGVQRFLRDVLAMANASVEGPRYIVTGAEIDARGRKRLYGIGREDFSGKPAYQALANEYIEPGIRIRYQPVTIDGERIGVFEIGDCQDRPYMMRVDYSETLRRGDAYARVNEAAVKLGRRQLQKLFEIKFQDSVSAAAIEIGFAGDIIHKDLRVATCGLADLPSAVASAKLHELIDAKDRVHASAANTMLARLTHARLFGSDSPYEERSTEEIRQEIAQIERRYRDQDHHYLFEQRATNIQLVVYNQGEEDINDASITLVMPNHSAFHVATGLPKVPRDNRFVERTPSEQADYPAVTLRDGAIQVSATIGDLPSGEPVKLFDAPLRICAGPELKGRRIGIQYSLQAQNLRAAATGKLRLLFQ